MVTIDLKYTLICIVLVALIALLVYLVLLVRSLLPTIKKVDKLLDDASVVTGVATGAVNQVDGIVNNLGGAINDVGNSVRGNPNFVGAVSNIAKAVTSTVSYFNASDQDDFYAEEARRQRKQNR